MKTYYYYLIFSFLFIYTTVYSQDIPAKNVDHKNLIVKKDFLLSTEYFYYNKTYDRQQLGEVLKKDPLAWDSYMKYLSRKKTSKTLKRISSTVAGITTIYIFANSDGDIEFFQTKKWIGPTLMSSIGTFIIAGFIKGAGLNKFVQSIDSFNENVKNKQRIGKTPIQLNLQTTQNGIGFVLNF